MFLGHPHVRPNKKYLVFRATRPYLSEPADPRLFFTKMPFFFPLKKIIKKPSRPYQKFLRSLPETQDFFFVWPKLKLVTETTNLTGFIWLKKITF